MSKKNLLPKDLLNDLERETNIKKRVMEMAKKKVDQPITVRQWEDMSILQPMSFASSASFVTTIRGW